MFGEDEIIRSHSSRAHALGNVILIAFAILLSRLWYLQIYKGPDLLEWSLKNRLRKEIVKAPRGMVFSRNGQLIVDNIPRFDAVLTPQYFKNKDNTLKNLSAILNMPVEKIKKRMLKKSTMASYKPIIIKKNISRKEVALIETENSDLHGVSVETFISREYRDKETGAHLLGYISEINKKQLPKYKKRDNKNYQLGDFIGQFGLEEQLDTTLRGQNGHEYVEVDALGRKKKHIKKDNLFAGIENKRSVPGLNVRLTIDRDMQLSGFKALEGKVGGAVAVSLKTGEILAMVSTPSFDPSQFSRGLSTEYWSSLVNNVDNPLRDRTIQEHYSPGSTFKMVTAVALLEEGLIDENTEIKCTGKFKLGRRNYHCWKKYGHGKVKLFKALRESCNIYFQKLSLKLDIDILAKYARMFGFGLKSGIKLPREVSGLFPTKEWKKKRNGIDWQLGETLSCAIGQSFVLASPLQMAMAYSVLGNGGTLYKPTLVKEVFSNSGEIIKRIEPVITKKIIISEKTQRLVKEGLYQVANHPKGTGWWRSIRKGLQLSGKTGTSQVKSASSSENLYEKCENKDYNDRHHGHFIGFGPKSDPQVAVAATIEHGCHGSSAALPIVTAIMSTYMKKYLPNMQKEFEILEKKVFAKEMAKRRKIKQRADEEKEQKKKLKEKTEEILEVI
ncbi:MAG: penicillin-binding protein 2 [Bacteriovoracaceae bacterium]|jgi:penicillin-binding protein 2|nr:penicillin-binding protein 2 [Bacteriovoracaceae bacterium]